MTEISQRKKAGWRHYDVLQHGQVNFNGRADWCCSVLSRAAAVNARCVEAEPATK